MYKKLHNKETLPSWKPLYAKGFLFLCVPERDIMLTTFVYHIQVKNRKNSTGGREFFLLHSFY
jgi:hypothetical protein